jgi:hypothetical protein
MMSVVVSMVISSLYLNIILSLFMLQQTLFHVCHRTDNYSVTLFVKKAVIVFATGPGLGVFYSLSFNTASLVPPGTH